MWVGQLWIVSRGKAELRDPRDKPQAIPGFTAKRSWLHHTAVDPDIPLDRVEVHREPKRSERAFFRSMCNYWREVQAFHMDSRKWNDVGYSYGVAPGIFGLRPRVFEGRGAGIIGAHTEGDNSESLGIVVFGNFDQKRVLGWLTRRKIKRLLDELVAIGALEGPRYKHPTGGHQDAPDAATRCPGTHLMTEIPKLRRRARR